MVNKQYNIQNIKKSKNRSPPISRNLAVISSVPNPPNCAASNNLDPITEEFCATVNNFSEYDRNLTHLNNEKNFITTDEEDNYEKLCDRNLTINDIGRFQYILQMDKEMETQSNRLFKLSPPQQLSFTPYSATSSINSNNNQINFWKAGSQSPINLPPFRTRRQKCLKHLRIGWKFLKWPLCLFILGTIVAMLTYFLFIETKLTQNLSQNSLILNSLANENSVENSTFSMVNKHVDLYNPSTNSVTKTSESITSSIKSTIEWSRRKTNQSDSDIQINTDNTTQRMTPTKSHQNVTTSAPSSFKPSRNTQILEISTQKLDASLQEIPIIVEDESKIMFPTKETLEYFGFTSGHQNNFGVPIEEDERILRMLNEQLIKNEKNKKNSSDFIMTTTTDSNIYRTRVSPTLPLLQTTDVTTEPLKNFNISLDDEICQSTSLPLCRSILHYDLTVAKRRKDFTPIELQHFEYLITSKCSLRSHEFVCSVLEPECRPKRMGALVPCKRVCKSILEPCGHIIAASEILTLLFDCDSYPDSNDPTVCRDITRNKKCFRNEFQCQDLTCIPLQWKCDNIKDCAVAEDEANCKFCEQDEFRCIGTDKCIPEKWRCDQYEDCPDATDEMDCFEDESRTTFSLYENRNLFASLDSYSDSKLSSERPHIPEDDRLNVADSTEKKRPLYITTEKVKDVEYSTNSDTFDILETTTKLKATNEEVDEIQGAASGIIIPISKSLANFQDSKEIMMTSDSEADYKYSSSNTVTTKTSHSSPCPEGELRCVSGQCITLSQLCDKVTDCPDGADEAMCVFKT